jgi:hypothetical protein
VPSLSPSLQELAKRRPQDIGVKDDWFALSLVNEDLEEVPSRTWTDVQVNVRLDIRHDPDRMPKSVHYLRFGAVL